MTKNEIFAIFVNERNDLNIKGMSRFGINTENAFGIPMPRLNELAKFNKKNHKLALELWDSGYHEAKILAALIDNPEEVTEEQMENWVIEIDSWDICDQVMMKLFDKSKFAIKKIYEWSNREEEFVKRSAFSLIASISLHDKKSENTFFTQFIPLIYKAASDERNFVKKSVNWALRQIGKKNKYLYIQAYDCAEKIKINFPNSKSANWIANDAIREFNSPKIKERLGIES